MVAGDWYAVKVLRKGVVAGPARRGLASQPESLRPACPPPPSPSWGGGPQAASVPGPPFLRRPAELREEADWLAVLHEVQVLQQLAAAPYCARLFDAFQSETAVCSGPWHSFSTL